MCFSEVEWLGVRDQSVEWGNVVGGEASKCLSGV